MNVEKRTRQMFARLTSVIVGLIALALVVFHAALLWERLLDSSIAQPDVLMRWLASGLMVAGLLIARRRVRHVVIVFWLLVALLHAGIPADQQLLHGTTQWAVIVQVGITTACGALFFLVIAPAADSASRPGSVELTEALAPLSGAPATTCGRSPPAF